MLGKPCLGDVPPTGSFRSEHNPAEQTLEAWVAEAPIRNQKMLQAVKSSGDQALDEKAWEKLQAELDMGYCIGPGEVADLDLESVCLTP